MTEQVVEAYLPSDDDANDLEDVVLGGPQEFLYDGRAFTADEFDQFVMSYDFGQVKPDFIVLHHTGLPAASWAHAPGNTNFWDEGQGGMSREAQIEARLKRMAGIRNYYRDSLQWDRGPHLFIDDIAIYTFTPLRSVGIHTKGGNSYQEGGRLHYSIGIEVVGNYTQATWPAPVLANVAAAVCSLRAALQNFTFVSGRGAGQIAEHRMYNKPSCPGDAIRPAFYMPAFEQAWAARGLANTLAPPLPARAPEPAQITPDTTLLAPPRTTIAAAARYILAQPHGDYSESDITEVILPAYWRLCSEVGLDPLLAVAQMIHETDALNSWWAARPRRNPAGLGVTGATSPTRPARGSWVKRDGVWAEGLTFASWDGDAIPAHVGRLLAYALGDHQAAPTQLNLIGKALGLRALPGHCRGCAATLRGLNGTWADPGLTYADGIARHANAILAAGR